MIQTSMNDLLPTNGHISNKDKNKTPNSHFTKFDADHVINGS